MLTRHIVYVYPERLTKLRLPSLYYRRARGDMIYAYKHMTGLYKVAELQTPGIAYQLL